MKHLNTRGRKISNFHQFEYCSRRFTWNIFKQVEQDQNGVFTSAYKMQYINLGLIALNLIVVIANHTQFPQYYYQFAIIHLLIHPSIRPSVRPSVCSFIHPSLNPSIHSFIYLFIYLFLCNSLWLFLKRIPSWGTAYLVLVWKAAHGIW